MLNVIIVSIIILGIMSIILLLFSIGFVFDTNFKPSLLCFIFSIICGVGAYTLPKHFFTDYNVQYEKAPIHTVMKKPDRVIILMKDGTSITSYKIQWLQTKNIYRRTWNEKWSDDKLQQYIYSESDLTKGDK